MQPDHDNIELMHGGLLIYLYSRTHTLHIGRYSTIRFTVKWVPLTAIPHIVCVYQAQWVLQHQSGSTWLIVLKSFQSFTVLNALCPIQHAEGPLQIMIPFNTIAGSSLYTQYNIILYFSVRIWEIRLNSGKGKLAYTCVFRKLYDV